MLKEGKVKVHRTGAAAAAGLLVLALSLVWFTAAPAQSPETSPRTDDLLITLEADSTPVVTVLEILAERSGLNIVTSPEVQGIPVSIRLSNTPFDEALNLVVRAAGMGYERVGKSILVGSPARLATQTGVTTKVFNLEYADAAEVKDALSVINKDISFFVSDNALIVKAPQATIEEIAKVLAELDHRPRQVMIQARLLQVDTSAFQELGVNWDDLSPFKTVVTEGNPGTSAAHEEPPSLGYTKFNESPDFYRQLASFKVTLDLLVGTGDAKLLANSKVTTMENQNAEIFIGTRTPVVTSQLSGVSGGTFQNVQIEYIDTGVTLNITPRVSNDNFITVNLGPSVSNIVDYTPVGNYPITSERRAQSTVRLKDGQTFFLGGLLLEANRESVSKVPLLGDIPILGYLFRHYKTDTQNTDLIIEITPTIVEDMD